MSPIRLLPVLLACVGRRRGSLRQQGEIHAVRPLIEQKLAELAETIRLRQQGDASGALVVVRTGRGAALMVQIRVHIRSLIDEENRLLGIITQDDVADVLEEEATEDI